MEERVRDLLARMTPREKFRQLFMIPGSLDSGTELLKDGIFGLQVEAAESAVENGPERSMKSNGFSGTAPGSGSRSFPSKKPFTGWFIRGPRLFPQAIGLAATFRSGADGPGGRQHRPGSQDARHPASSLPVVNIADDVRWGRVEETYGEDPFLAAEMGRAFVAAFEREGVITTPKHLLANSGAGGRDSYPIHWNERLLRELYLPPFEACLRRGGSRSVMTAYNSLDGRPA